MALISRVGTTAIAVVVSGALVAGVAAADSGPGPNRTAGTHTGAKTKTETNTNTQTHTQTGTKSGGGAQGEKQGKKRGGKTTTVTLVTGDRVVVRAGGKQVVRLIRGEGREEVAIAVRREAGHTYVVPQDAQSLISAGRLDRRLFDVTRLVRDKYDDAHRTSLPLIVKYRPGRVNSRSGDTFKGLARDRRTLPALGGEAFEAPKSGTGDVWRQLTGYTGGRTNARSTAAPAIAHVWLDAKVRPALDKSVPQIGAPTMWRAGYTGKGVKVAVLDTGVDQTHPDLKNVEVAEKNFTESAPDAKDRMGHGTHVASTLAGSGAKSGGKYKGVAPDVQVLDGKVISEVEGTGSESSIAAGMQWAVDSKAKIVNLSLGSLDSPGTDPLEEAVARLSGKALFVIAAGNDGPEPGTLNSPGSAPAALTVGSVDKQDNIAETSSRGPQADGVTKPDLTAPGDDITAARSTQIPGDSEHEPYVAMSGTSMATPHVAGSAALLLQQHPTWSGPQLKAALTGSATPHPALNAHQQGAGRVDLTRAVTASVVPEPGTLAFGTQAWPHTDDKPVAKTLTYRNLGTKPVTLTLSAKSLDPKGRPGPADLFTVKDAEVTVPAGGTAKTTVTADTRLGTANGVYGGTLLATGDGQEVRTGLVVDREVESYDLTLKHLDINGGNSLNYTTTLTDARTQRKIEVPYKEGLTTLRVPKGTYALESTVYGPTKSFAVFVQPKLKVAAKATLTLDSRKAKPVAVTAPDAGARLTESYISYDDTALGIANSFSLGEGAVIRTLGLGSASPTLNAQYNGVWKAPAAKSDYRLAFSRTGSWFSGLKHATTKAELAEVKYGVGASAARRKGTLTAAPIGTNDYYPPLQPVTALKLPASGTSYVNTKDLRWSWSMAQLDDAGDSTIDYGTAPTAYKAGKRYTLNFNTAVVGPDLNADEGQGARRAGNAMDAYVQLFSDGAGHAGSSVTSGGFTRLESGGRTLAEGGPGAVNAELPAALASYRLIMEATRAATVATTSTKVAATWTFKSAKTPDEPPTDLPLSTVRLAPELALNGTAPAGSTLTVPLKVAGAAAGTGRITTLTVKVSYDGGRTWKAAPVTTDTRGARTASVKHPATAKAVSYRVYLKDTSGNTMTETITNAYRLTP
ncbi:S8 family peptidase [Streptomyces sp. NPDC093510]|uniref:S8 family peptidase n=1 Tax=Streptomyces sp. NPDC093510 TaxID=3155199 RepID=UPI003429FB5C